MAAESIHSILTGAESMQLFAQSWLPDPAGPPLRGGVLIVHGFGEHSGRYGYLVEALTAHGYAVSGFDHRGHGQSPGLRGHIDRWDQFAEDVRAAVAAARLQVAPHPLFLFGHSMGGLVALNYAIRYPEGLAGIIASAPLLTQPNVSPVLNLAARALSSIKPDFPLKSGLDANGISREPEEVQRYRNDPLNHDKATARLGTEMIKTIDWTQQHASELRIPILIYHGSGDRIVPIQGSRTFYSRLTVQDKQWIEWPEGYHESHNDLHRAEVFNAILDWLNAHVAQPTQ